MNWSNLSYVAPEDIDSSGVSSTPIPVEDVISISTGTYKGRIKLFSTFNSKDRKTLYAKITIGTQINLPDGKQTVAEFNRVWHADFHQGSHLIEALEKLGAIQDKKVIPDKLFNLPVQFELIADDNYTSSSGKYKELISTIELIDSLPDDLDFEYVRVNRVGYTEIVPTNDKMQSNADIIIEDDYGEEDFDKLFDEDD